MKPSASSVNIPRAFHYDHHRVVAVVVCVDVVDAVLVVVVVAAAAAAAAAVAVVVAGRRSLGKPRSVPDCRDPAPEAAAVAVVAVVVDCCCCCCCYCCLNDADSVLPNEIPAVGSIVVAAAVDGVPRDAAVHGLHVVVVENRDCDLTGSVVVVVAYACCTVSCWLVAVAVVVVVAAAVVVVVGVAAEVASLAAGAEHLPQLNWPLPPQPWTSRDC